MFAPRKGKKPCLTEDTCNTPAPSRLHGAAARQAKKYTASSKKMPHVVNVKGGSTVAQAWPRVRQPVPASRLRAGLHVTAGTAVAFVLLVYHLTRP
jgi:hypothetical protein